MVSPYLDFATVAAVCSSLAFDVKLAEKFSAANAAQLAILNLRT